MKISNDFRPFQHVCTYCHPNYREEMYKESGFFKSNGSWKDPTDENRKKYEEFEKSYLKDKIKTVIFLDPDQFITCCRDHLQELINVFDAPSEKDEEETAMQRINQWKEILLRQENKSKDENLRNEIQKDIDTFHNIIKKK